MAAIFHFSPASRHFPRRSKGYETSSFFSLLAILAWSSTAAAGGNSQFHFDTSGNLQAQTSEITGLPQILAQPQDQVVVPGDAASFSVVVADTRGLTYQWQFKGASIGGATGDALLLQGVGGVNEGDYRVVLANASGSVTSSPAALMLDSDGDGLPDSWEMTYFTNLNQTATGDFDGDGVSNFQEFLDGTDPTDAASARYRIFLVSDIGTVVTVPNQASYTNGQVVTLTATGSAAAPFHAWLGDVLTHSNFIMLTMTNNKTLFARFTPITFQWTNSSAGDWNTASDWSPNLAPGSNDIVQITSGTVTLNNDADLDDFTLGPGTLTGTGVLTIHGSGLWTAGAMNGSGRTVIAPGATLDLDNPLSVSLNSRTLENRGTVLWTNAGRLDLSSAVITNDPGALFEAQNAALVYAISGANRFDNAGTFRKTSAGTNTFSNVALNNYGTLDLQTGTLQCGASFLNSGNVTVAPGTTLRLLGGGSSSSTFAAPATALVEFNSGTFVLNAGAQLNGAGLFKVDGGTLTAGTDVALENLDLASALNGTGIVTVSNLLNWTVGTMSGTGRTIIAPGATLNLNNSSTTTLASRTLENRGTVLWTNAGRLDLSSAVITNDPGALFEAQNAGEVFGISGANRLDNAGTFAKTSGGTNTFSNVALNNYGMLDLQAGTLQCGASFLNSGNVTVAPGATLRLLGGGSSSSTFAAPATALVEFNSGTFVLNAGAKLNGAGLFKVDGGALTAGTDVALENLDLASALNGTGIVTVSNLLNWTVGTMSGTGRTIIAPGATLNLNNSSTTTLASRTLENRGTVLWTNVGRLDLSSAVITNDPGALFEAQNAALVYGVSGANRFDNAGTFRKASSGKTVFDNLVFNNYGTVEIQSGLVAAAAYYSSPDALMNFVLGGTSPGTNYGQLQVSGQAALDGTLSVDLIKGFVPATNDTFTVLTAGTRTGQFESFSYPSNQVTMQLSNTTSSVVVHVAAVGALAQIPMLLSPVISGSNVVLTWTTISNTTYRLEFSPDLRATNWSPLPGGDVLSLSNTASKTDTLISSNRFYRVRVLP